MDSNLYSRLIKEELLEIFKDSIRDLLVQNKIVVDMEVAIPNGCNLFNSKNISLTLSLQNTLTNKTIFFSIASVSLKDLKENVENVLTIVILSSKLFE